jgi:hypothetical protein
MIGSAELSGLKMTPFRLALLLLFAGLLATRPAAAAAHDAFSIRGVEVDVTAANVTAAKELALVEAQRVAFRRLLDRLTVATDTGRLPNADATQYVRDFAIEHERSSTVRYIASLTVRFNAAAVRKLLREAGVHYAEARPRAVVVVPVFKGKDGRLVLWDDPNPWRAAWYAQGTGGLVPMLVPQGDVIDTTSISAEQAMAFDPVRIEAVVQRYRTPDVLVAAAAISPSGNEIDVSIKSTPGVPRLYDAKSFELAEGAAPDAVLRQAAAELTAAIDSAYKQGNLLQFDRAATISTLVPLSGLEEWLAVRQRLSHVTQVRRFEVVSLSRQEAALVLHIVGDQEQVRTALAGAGLALEWGDGYWVMRQSIRR